MGLLKRKPPRPLCQGRGPGHDWERIYEMGTIGPVGALCHHCGEFVATAFSTTKCEPEVSDTELNDFAGSMLKLLDSTDDVV